MLSRKIREEAFRLRAEEDMSYNEISRRLGVSCSTVKSWFHRAGLYSAREYGMAERGEGTCIQTSWRNSSPFSDEDVRILSENPYVKSVTENQVRFTPAFREEYWKRYKDGQEPADILKNLGIDPEILGQSRIVGLHKRICDAAANGFISAAAQTPPADLFADSVVPAKALIQMQHELSYVKQELEFIKKIISLEKEEKS